MTARKTNNGCQNPERYGEDGYEANDKPEGLDYGSKEVIDEALLSSLMVCPLSIVTARPRTASQHAPMLFSAAA